ncbi:MAG: Fe-S cluster biogenesis protein NfuA [Myxococcota bacterium]|jgi:Fe-S cluster biogenesis protein NfuA
MRDRLKRAIKNRFPVVVSLRDRIRGAQDSDTELVVADPAGPVASENGDVITHFTRAQVEELVEEMVRPALESDGGDIEIVRIEEGDIYVRLLGACVGCPSSRMTLQMGVERLLHEELDGFHSLIELPSEVSAA